MRFIQPGALLFGAVAYVGILVFQGTPAFAGALHWSVVVVCAWNLLLAVAMIVAIVDSAHKVRARETDQLTTDALVVKIAAIPFFALNFAVLFAMAGVGGALFLFGGMVLWVAVVLGIGLTYLAMLSTSVYTWAAIAQLRRDGTISWGVTVLYTVLSLIVVTDTAVGVLVFAHARRRPNLAVVMILAAWGLGVAIAGLVLCLMFGFRFGHGYVGLGWVLAAGVALLLAAMVVALVRLPALRVEGSAALVDLANKE